MTIASPFVPVRPYHQDDDGSMSMCCALTDVVAAVVERHFSVSDRVAVMSTDACFLCRKLSPWFRDTQKR